MEELFQLADRELKRSEFCDLLGAGVVITGGTALMDGAVELAEQVFGHPVRVGAPVSVEGVTAPVDDPRLSTSVGLALYGLRRQQHGWNGRRGIPGKNMFRWMRRWVQEFN